MLLACPITKSITSDLFRSSSASDRLKTTFSMTHATRERNVLLCKKMLKEITPRTSSYTLIIARSLRMSAQSALSPHHWHLPHRRDAGW